MARLIRAASAAGLRVEPPVASAQRDASAILERAEREAAQIRTAAEADAQAILGEAEARAGEAVRAEAVAARLKQLKAGESVRRDAKDDLLRLALGIAKKIIDRELQAHPAQLQATLEEALRRAGGEDAVVLHVRPEDVEAARRLRPDGVPEGALEVLADPSLGLGDCRVFLEGGSLDARIETRLDAIRQALDSHS